MTWHRPLGHPAFKTVIALGEGMADSTVIIGLPGKIPGLAACTTCVAAKSAHLLHKEGCERVDKQSQRVQIDMAGPMPVKSARGNECEYVVMDDYSWAVYLRHYVLSQRGRVQNFQSCSKNESDNKMHEVMTDNACELKCARSATRRAFSLPSGMQRDRETCYWSPY